MIKILNIDLPITMENIIGQGSFSMVSLVEQNGIEYAVKKMKREYNSDTVMTNILREVSIQETMNHANIIKLLGKQRDKENYYLIFEYCIGGDLQ